jgi:hypothetical protein
MTIRGSAPGNLSRGTRLRAPLLLAMILSTGGCATLVEGALEAALGDAVAIRGDDDPMTVATARPAPEAPPSVYLVGPVAGWDRSPLTLRPFRPPTALFGVDPFAGACPGLYLATGQTDGPFGTGSRVGFQWIDLTPSHTADRNFYRPGEVSFTGASDPTPLWAGTPMASQGYVPPWALSARGSGPVGTCASVVGIPLLSFGRPDPPSVFR